MYCQCLSWWACCAGALVFNDTLWPNFNTSRLQDLNVTQVEGMFKSSGVAPSSTFNRTFSELVHSPTGQGIYSPVTLLFNTSSDHSLPALIQELMQARLKASLGDASATLKVSNHPLPLTKTEFLELETVLSVLAALFVLIPFCYLGATFAVFVVRERIVKAKLLQVRYKPLLSYIFRTVLSYHSEYYCQQIKEDVNTAEHV